MRVLLRVLAPLLGLTVAVAGVLFAIEVVAAWVRTPADTGLLVPWPDWRAALENLTWATAPVPAVAVGVGMGGLVLVLVGLFARRHDVALEPPAPGITVTTSPRVLARLVGRRVRATDDVAAASVTTSGRKVTVAVQGWSGDGPALRTAVRGQLDSLLDDLPLARTPRVTVSVQQRKGPR